METYLGIKNIFCGEDDQYSFLSKSGNEDYTPFNGSTFASENRRYRYFNVSLCHKFELDARFKGEKEKRHTIKNVSILSSNLLCALLTSKMEAYPPVSTRQYFSIAWNIFQP